MFEPPFEKWTWQIEVTEPSEDLDMGGGLSLVEVIIQSEELGGRHAFPNDPRPSVAPTAR